MRSVNFFVLDGIPSITPGIDLGAVIAQAAAQNGVPLEDGDVVVLAQKIVSKAEDRYVDLNTVTPSEKAVAIAEVCKKDPRIVELILGEAVEVVRCIPNVIVVRDRNGLVLANAGIDQSNLPGGEASNKALLLPKDPDASADRIRAALEATSGKKVGVAVIDSLGRAWRIGTFGTCIGASGIETVRDMRGKKDLYGRTLQSTIIGLGDELAGGASMVMGQAAEGTPVVIVRGSGIQQDGMSARNLVRPLNEDLFK